MAAKTLSKFELELLVRQLNLVLVQHQLTILEQRHAIKVASLHLREKQPELARVILARV
jgi:hypothetical protein